MEGRVPILLGCLHASRTIVFLFFIQLRSPLRSFMEKQIYGKAKAYDTKAADTLQSKLQNLPIVHKIQGVKMIFLVALFSRLPPSASIFCHFPWAIPKSLCLIISGCGRFFVILHLESAGYAAPAESANPIARKRILNQ